MAAAVGRGGADAAAAAARRSSSSPSRCVVGALWAAIAALLKVYRGVSEVISTIMLNFIGDALVAWLLDPAGVRGRSRTTSSGRRPSRSPAGSRRHVERHPDRRQPGRRLRRDLRVHRHLRARRRRLLVRRSTAPGSASTCGRPGCSEPRRRRQRGGRQADGRSPSMLLSGAVAGLVGMPILLGAAHSFGSQDFPSGIGFTGIAIALLGRNNPVGIAFASRCSGASSTCRTRSSTSRASPRRSSRSCRASIVLAVVVAYEVVRRIGVAAEQRRVCRRRSPRRPPPAGHRRRRPGGGAMSLTNERAGVERRRRARPGARPTPGGPVPRTAVYAVVAVLVSCPSPGQLSPAPNDITSSGTVGAALAARRPDPARGPGWPVVRARGRREHRPRGHDGPRHLVRRLRCADTTARGSGCSPGIAGGALGGLVHAVATVTFGVDHIVSGVAINMLGPGIARFLVGPDLHRVRGRRRHAEPADRAAGHVHRAGRVRRAALRRAAPLVPRLRRGRDPRRPGHRACPG